MMWEGFWGRYHPDLFFLRQTQYKQIIGHAVHFFKKASAALASFTRLPEKSGLDSRLVLPMMAKQYTYGLPFESEVQ